MAKGNGYLRARIRHAVLTRTADRLTLGALGRRHRAQAIEVRRIELRVPRWPRTHDGMRIAHVTDFHLGDLMPLGRALGAQERLAALRPDLLACTGDVVDLDLDGAEPLLAAMGAIEAPLGRFLVLGNHDHLEDGHMLASMAVMRGLQVPHGEVVPAGGGSDPLLVGGVDWARGVRTLDRMVDALPSRPHLLLAHNPKVFPAAARARIPLTLAGHTHGGQVALRDRPRANLSMLHGHSSGLYERGSSRLFVNVGAGSWFPLRRNVPAEIVMLEVRRA